jgi:hypothetical protein
MDLQQATKEELIEKIRALRRELYLKNETLHERNLALDALHYVWCDGNCPGGVHRYSDEAFTEDIVLQAEYQALRLRHKYDSMLWCAENWPDLPETQTAWHQEYLRRIRSKILHVQKGVTS